MDRKTKCKICGCTITAIVILTSYPVCKNCYITSIQVSASSSSSSSNSTTTTQLSISN